MVELLSRDLLRREAGQLPIIEEAVVRKAERQSPSRSTFLSHSSVDADRLPYVVTILERHGAAVYVDKKDTTLPAVTSRETAEGLKSRIKRSRKFILLTSTTSKDSRRMPWELGLAGVQWPEECRCVAQPGARDTAGLGGPIVSRRLRSDRRQAQRLPEAGLHDLQLGDQQGDRTREVAEELSVLALDGVPRRSRP